jgi:uncharacterized protein (TIGR03067 family)
LQKTTLSLCLALAVTCSGTTYSADESAAKPAMGQLEGVWSFVLVKVDGKEQPSAGHPADRMIIQRDGRFTVVQRPRITHGALTVNPEKNPKQYDVKITDGPRKGTIVPAIYEIEGDKLTICLPLAGIERPTEVASKPGDGHLFEVFKREHEDVKEALIAAGRRELTGTWQAVSYALDGKKASDDDMKKIQLVFDAEGKSTALNDGKVFIASTTKIDPSANPATIDITFSEGDGKGATALGIYKIEGGVLTICRSAPGKPRPAEFSSDPGSGLTLMTYKLKAATRKSFRARP